MAEKTPQRNTRYVAKKKPSKPKSHWFRNVVLRVFVAGAFLLFCFLGYLDSNVREQFEGKRWAIPARVFASPLELYAGQNLTLEKFEELLQRLNYHQDKQLKAEGSYAKKDLQIVLKTRAFDFWDSREPSRMLTVKFSESAIANVMDLAEAKEMPIVRMDPVQIGSFYPAIKEDRILIKLE